LDENLMEKGCMPTTKTERSYHPNGQLEWEGTFVDGSPHGIQRRWYPNGVLSDETPIQNGTYEGVGKHWNDKGELVGTWEVNAGTGVWRH
jgi:antitoxin component YwqK of YwqJK toxin-antitoxin module